MSSHKRNSHSAAYATSGNLALSPEYAPKFTLIEGGLSKHESFHEVRSRRNDATCQHQNQNSRIFICSVLAMVCVAFALLISAFVSDALIRSRQAEVFGSVPKTSITVVEGDCLWSLAERHPVPGLTTRDVSRLIMSYNQLDSSMLISGQSLVVPA